MKSEKMFLRHLAYCVITSIYINFGVYWWNDWLVDDRIFCRTTAFINCYSSSFDCHSQKKNIFSRTKSFCWNQDQFIRRTDPLSIYKQISIHSDFKNKIMISKSNWNKKQIKHYLHLSSSNMSSACIHRKQIWSWFTQQFEWTMTRFNH